MNCSLIAFPGFELKHTNLVVLCEHLEKFRRHPLLRLAKAPALVNGQAENNFIPRVPCNPFGITIFFTCAIADETCKPLDQRSALVLLHTSLSVLLTGLSR